MAMGVGGKYTTKLLGIFYLLGDKYNIEHHVLKVVDYKMIPIIQDLAHKPMYQNSEDELLLTLEHRI